MIAVHAFRHWWQSREPREQRMLAVMFTAVAAFVVWFGLVVPLQYARDAARDRHHAAATDLREVVRAVDTVNALQARNPGMTRGDAFSSAILDTAAAAQVPISRKRTDEDGMLEVGVDAVDAPALLGWLDRLHHQHAIAPLTLDISERNGRLQVQARFRSPPP